MSEELFSFKELPYTAVIIKKKNIIIPFPVIVVVLSFILGFCIGYFIK